MFGYVSSWSLTLLTLELVPGFTKQLNQANSRSKRFTGSPHNSSSCHGTPSQYNSHASIISTLAQRNHSAYTMWREWCDLSMNLKKLCTRHCANYTNRLSFFNDSMRGCCVRYVTQSRSFHLMDACKLKSTRQVAACAMHLYQRRQQIGCAIWRERWHDTKRTTLAKTWCDTKRQDIKEHVMQIYFAMDEDLHCMHISQYGN
jgi:hypothetical protein